MNARTGAMSYTLEDIDQRAIDTSAILFALRHPDRLEAMRRLGQARIDALFIGHDASVRAEQERRWAEEEGEAIVAAMNRSGGVA